MIKKIDIERSKKDNRVYFHYDILSVGIRWFSFLYFTFFPPSFALYNVSSLKGDPFGQIILVTASLVFSGFIILLAINPNKNKLIRISGDKLNKDKLKRIIDELDWFIEVNETDYMIVIPKSWNYQVTIIFDKDDFLISSVRLSHNTYTFNDGNNLNKLLDKIG